MEDTKHEQLLMLTFSRAAATEFRQRLGMKDVFLDFFIGKKADVFKLRSGDELEIRGNFLYANGKKLVIPSKAVREKLEGLRTKGYVPYKAKVCFIVEWVNQETGESAAVVLSDIWLH